MITSLGITGALITGGLGGNYMTTMTASYSVVAVESVSPMSSPVSITGGSVPYAPGTYMNSWKVIAPLSTIDTGPSYPTITIVVKHNDVTICDRTYDLRSDKSLTLRTSAVVPSIAVVKLSPL